MGVAQKKILELMPHEQRSRLIGDIVTLMLQSPEHQKYKLEYISSMVLPPVQLNQYRIYHDAKKRPVGFVAWASVSKAVEKKLLNEAKPLTMEEWASGDKIFIMEFIAPHGHAPQIIKDLKAKYPNQIAHAVRYDATGKKGKTITVYEGDGKVGGG